MKIGQLLSTIPDLLPPEYVNALSQLQSNAPPMGWNFVKRRMKSELGPNWEKKFKKFENEPFAAAKGSFSNFLNFFSQFGPSSDFILLFTKFHPIGGAFD